MIKTILGLGKHIKKVVSVEYTHTKYMYKYSNPNTKLKLRSIKTTISLAYNLLLFESAVDLFNLLLF